MLTMVSISSELEEPMDHYFPLFAVELKVQN